MKRVGYLPPPSPLPLSGGAWGAAPCYDNRTVQKTMRRVEPTTGPIAPQLGFDSIKRTKTICCDTKRYRQTHIFCEGTKTGKLCDRHIRPSLRLQLNSGSRACLAGTNYEYRELHFSCKKQTTRSRNITHRIYISFGTITFNVDY